MTLSAATRAKRAADDAERSRAVTITLQGEARWIVCQALYDETHRLECEVRNSRSKMRRRALETRADKMREVADQLA